MQVNPKLRTMLERHWTQALVVGLVAFSVCATCSALRWPTPSIHDEFSYLLAADTFAEGRLTNPTHPLWQHFETFHVIHEPSYASKYPPGQGLFLALGQKLAGQPIVGVWILSGLAAAACYWMLLGWLPVRWAIVGAFLFAVHPGYQIIWGQSYWGGTLAFLGGALVFGAVARMRARPKVRDAIAMSVGAILLAISRPYEGFIFCLIAGAAVIVDWVRHGLPPWRLLVCRVVLPQMFVFLMGGACLLVHNQAVTGDWRKLPYQVHEKTYGLSPCFLWKEPRLEKEYRHLEMTTFHHGWEMESYYKQSTLAGLIDTKLKLFWYSWRHFFPLPLMASLVFMPLCRYRHKWTVLAVASAGWLPSMVTVWNFPHYVASVAPALMVLVLLGLRQINRLGKKHLDQPRLALLLVACQIAFFAICVVGYVTTPQASWQWQRAALAEQLEETDGRHLVLVHYHVDHNPHQEWVYNRADIDNSKVVWARPMGPSNVPQLLEYFDNRTVWLLDADAAKPQLAPYLESAAGEKLSAALSNKKLHTHTD